MNCKQLIRTLAILFAICTSCTLREKGQNDAVANENVTGRFFSATSFWNQAIGADPEIDPRNDQFISLLKSEPTGNNFGINTTKWTKTPTTVSGMPRCQSGLRGCDGLL